MTTLQSPVASGPGSHTGEVLLEVINLEKHFPILKGLLRHKVGAVRAVDGIDFAVHHGEALGLVGESGCGKSTTGRLITRLLEPTGGQVVFDGRDISHLPQRDLRSVRQDIQMIFQDPYASLNPRQTVGAIIATPLRVNHVSTPGGVKRRVQELLEIVGLNPEHYNRYPHEFSGGQRQRIGVARALALRPKLIVADEPVSALDVSIQAQIVNLLQGLQKEFDLSYLFIAHDLAVIRQFSHRVAVMYLGKIVEVADRNELYTRPLHPYTHALLSAVPEPDPDLDRRRERIRLVGDVPSPVNPPSGCRFRTRCWKATDKCAAEVPPLYEVRPGHLAACHYPEERDAAGIQLAQHLAAEESGAAPVQRVVSAPSDGLPPASGGDISQTDVPRY